MRSEKYALTCLSGGCCSCSCRITCSHIQFRSSDERFLRCQPDWLGPTFPSEVAELCTRLGARPGTAIRTKISQSLHRLISLNSAQGVDGLYCQAVCAIVFAMGKPCRRDPKKHLDACGRLQPSQPIHNVFVPLMPLFVTKRDQYVKIFFRNSESMAHVEAELHVTRVSLLHCTSK